MLTVIERDVFRVIEGQVPVDRFNARHREIREMTLQVLERLRKPETLHLIGPGRVSVVDVVNTSVCNGCAQVLVEALNSTDCIVPILDITSRTPGIEVGLQNLRTEYIVRTSDVESVLGVECSLIAIWWGTASITTVTRRESKTLRAYARAAMGITQSIPNAKVWITYAVLAYVFQQASVRLRPILTISSLLVIFPPEPQVIDQCSQ